MRLVYVAGPYSPLLGRSTERNIEVAQEWAVKLYKAGWSVITPNLNSPSGRFLEELPATHDFWLPRDIAILARCDAIFMLPRWQESKGAVEEHHVAQGLDLEILYHSDWEESCES